MPDQLTVRYGTTVLRRFRWTFLVGLGRLLVVGRRADVLVSGREIGVGLLQAVVAGRILRRPVAVTVQSRVDVAVEEYVGAQLRRWTTTALTRVDLAVTVSSGMLPTLMQIGLAPARVRSVTNGVDVERILAAAAQRPEVHLPPGPFIVGTGRLHRQKGFDLLLRAHAAARHAGAPAHHLVLVGDGPDRSSLEELVLTLGVADTVMFTGFVSNPHAIVARAEGFVLSSRWEGYPLALVEAICCGKPCIAADCTSGPSEVLDGGRFGALVKPDDEAALAAALQRHLEDPQPLQQRAVAGAAEARTRFDPDRAARAHLDLLAALSDARTTRPRPARERRPWPGPGSGSG